MRSNSSAYAPQVDPIAAIQNSMGLLFRSLNRAGTHLVVPSRASFGSTTLQLQKRSILRRAHNLERTGTDGVFPARD